MLDDVPLILVTGASGWLGLPGLASAVARELGYQPTVSLEGGMRRSLHWAVAQGAL